VKDFYRGTKSNQGGTKEINSYPPVRQEGSPKKIFSRKFSSISDQLTSEVENKEGKRLVQLKTMQLITPLQTVWPEDYSYIEPTYLKKLCALCSAHLLISW
jgi:hypothetical protein